MAPGSQMSRAGTRRLWVGHLLAPGKSHEEELPRGRRLGPATLPGGAAEGHAPARGAGV